MSGTYTGGGMDEAHRAYHAAATRKQAARWPDGREMRRKLAQGETIRRYLVEIDTHELGDPNDLGGTVMRERLDPFDSTDPPREYTIDWHEISPAVVTEIDLWVALFEAAEMSDDYSVTYQEAYDNMLPRLLDAVRALLNGDS